jgi:AAA family ATP:ADP antiporter
MPSRPHPLGLIGALRGASSSERRKVALLTTWFFFTIGTLWLLKPLRSASLLAHLGAAELPYIRFGSVVGVTLVVAVYSRVVNRFSRLEVARGASVIFAVLLVAFWLGLLVIGPSLGARREVVWALFIVVDVYATVMVAIFWTYTNDVMTPDEADRLYAPIGLGGILGGVAGGALVDGLVERVGPVHLIAVCAAVVLLTGGLAWLTEARLAPPPRAVAREERGALADALGGARLVLRSRYLLLMVGVVVGYEFAAAITDFAISVVFERSFRSEAELAKMMGRLGWIVSATALGTQLLLVPAVLSRKRIALLLPPLTMIIAAVALAALPTVAMAVLLASSDRGLNYSLQQVTKETLYVPLGDAEKYKAKAFIDVLVDRGAKAISSLALVAILETIGVSLAASLAVALAAMLGWAACARALGVLYDRLVGRPGGAAGTDALSKGGSVAPTGRGDEAAREPGATALSPTHPGPVAPRPT